MTSLTDLALALDPVQLVRSAGVEPDDWQKRVLRSRSPRLLLNCSRQSGKSTISAALAVHTALYEAGSLVLVLSPTLRQSQELFKKCLDLYRVVHDVVPPHAETALRLELTNGSRIVSLPGKEGTIRGYSSVRLLCVDEAARVDDGLYHAIRPMLAVSQGRLIALSTPFGTRGWWYEAWQHGEGWERYLVPATEIPRIAPEFLEEERQALGDWYYDQEYACIFREAESRVFSDAEIAGIIREGVGTWDL